MGGVSVPVAAELGKRIGGFLAPGVKETWLDDWVMQGHQAQIACCQGGLIDGVG